VAIGETSLIRETPRSSLSEEDVFFPWLNDEKVARALLNNIC
jgi:hypothetical protein